MYQDSKKRYVSNTIIVGKYNDWHNEQGYPRNQITLKTFFEWHFGDKSPLFIKDYWHAWIIAGDLGISPLPSSEEIKKDFGAGRAARNFISLIHENGLSLTGKDYAALFIQFLDAEALLEGRIDTYEKLQNVVALLNNQEKGYGYNITLPPENQFDALLAKANKIRDKQFQNTQKILASPKTETHPLASDRAPAGKERKCKGEFKKFKIGFTETTSRCSKIVYTGITSKCKKNVKPGTPVKNINLLEDINRKKVLPTVLNRFKLFCPDYTEEIPTLASFINEAEPIIVAINIDRWANENPEPETKWERRVLDFVRDAEGVEIHLKSYVRFKKVCQSLREMIGHEVDGEIVPKYRFDTPSEGAYNKAMSERAKRSNAATLSAQSAQGIPCEL